MGLFILGDHLGSASVVTNASGNTVGEDRFYPFGETRLTTGTIYTDRLFTGQREMAGLGIYHFKARFYSPKLGRFLSADSIVPGMANPQNLNRFSYVRNNPLRYTDPTGHVECRTQEECQDMGTTPGGGFSTPKPKPKGDEGGGGNDNDSGTTCYPGELTCYLAEELDCDSYSGYSPCYGGWHYYSNEDNPYLVCPAIYHCTRKKMIDFLLRFAYPGQNPSTPVYPGGTYPVSYNGVSLGALGMIRVDVSEDHITTVNTTLPGHIFYDGTVTRTLSQGPDGAWYVTTTGIGNSVEPVVNTMNQLMGPNIFENLDQQMADYIAAQH